MGNGTGWNETYLNEEGKWENGSTEKEAVFFDKIAIQIREAVFQFNKANHGAKRVNHAKILAGFTNAKFKVAENLPDDLAFGFLEPAKEYETVVRFSNASGKYTDDDSIPDLRGAALRLKTEKGSYDLLMTNAEIHHALTAAEAMTAINSGVENEKYAIKLPAQLPAKEAIMGAHTLDYLVANVGAASALRMANTLKTEMGLKVKSISTESFFSRAPFAIGNGTTPENAVAIKFRLRPAKEKPAQDYINAEKNLAEALTEELKDNDIVFYFEVQRYSNPDDTPIENSTKAWTTPYEQVAALIIPKNSIVENEKVDILKFSPWNVDTNYFRPLGNMNRARKKVYEAGQDERLRQHPQG